MKATTKLIVRQTAIVAVVIALAVIPLLWIDSDFGGADGKAEELIAELAPSYEPWFSSFFELPSETESMLFALQAAIGASVIGYVLGLMRGRASSTRSESE
ncbi:energy-coupling factor ABC transporter substrate-binding protein [Paenibacillus sp. YYML68]|uniref:energy-coupling factor ABC transporter substrate-binding protein n=1 Tax=Paenibacillus sp. YYML68 TaxID=2909250 RepID=UPI00248FFDD6|nr:energy-coupling factor ABC transporter substrate-binding protein [Paenibacillus sp. YYML68]